MPPKDDDGSHIRIHLRVRPTKTPSPYLHLGARNEEDVPTQVSFEIPQDVASGYVNNTKTSYRFRFDGLLEMEATQDRVFDMVGRDAVANAMKGFNSTVFAYGQTGSGKTFTITGGPERYADRGIIPRAISMIFNELKKRPDIQYQIYVSYLEIYNESGYDLLDAGYEQAHTQGKGAAGPNGHAGLPRVSQLEDEDGNCHLKGLSMNLVATEEEALNFLFLGDTNRAIAETTMNEASSRSHCIFCVSLEGRKAGSDKVLRSKLNLVDLAGSERVHKTNAVGNTLKEAKYINTSLFYLEMVILALHEKRAHVPYRNSMMTSVLRDSLGGNCKTIMIATISGEKPNTDESISTCRFAQRVAMIKNDATVNEDVDPHQVIRRLKGDIQALRAEVAFLKGEAGQGGELSEEEREEVRGQCTDYIRTGDDGQDLALRDLSLARIRYAFSVFREMCRAGAGADGEKGVLSSPSDEDTEQTIRELRDTLAQRESEIMILVNMVKSGKGAKGLNTRNNGNTHTGNGHTNAHTDTHTTTNVNKPVLLVPPPQEAHILDNAETAFEYFRGVYPRNGPMEENKALLKERYATAKAIGEKVNQARSTINYLKKTIEQIRREKAMRGLLHRDDDDHDDTGCDEKEDGEEDEEEEQTRKAIEREKAVYQASFQKLRELKSEIEGIQRLLEKGRAKMQAEFDDWYQKVCEVQPWGCRSNITSTQQAASTPSRSRSASSPDNPPATTHPHTHTHTPTHTTTRTHTNGYDTRLSSHTHTDVEAHSGVHTHTHTGVYAHKHAHVPSYPSTGNAEADEDIKAFYRAKEELLRRTGGVPMPVPTFE